LTPKRLRWGGRGPGAPPPQGGGGNYILGTCPSDVIDGVDGLHHPACRACSFGAGSQNCFEATSQSPSMRCMPFTGPVRQRLWRGCWEQAARHGAYGTPRKICGGHPDPKPPYAHERRLLARMATLPLSGRLADGDGDRTWFWPALFREPQRQPGSTHRQLPIWTPGFPAAWADGWGALDAHERRCGCGGQELGISCYVTPTGWKFFGNLLDAGPPSASAARRASAPASDHIAKRWPRAVAVSGLLVLAVRRCSVAEVMPSMEPLRAATYYFTP